MNCSDINIRDPFVLCENGKYYMYGTRAVDFGRKTGGFDVYVSSDLKEWSRAECFDSEKAGLNREVNWAPEVHKYNGRYYMFASLQRKTVCAVLMLLRRTALSGRFANIQKER